MYTRHEETPRSRTPMCNNIIILCIIIYNIYIIHEQQQAGRCRRYRYVI